MADNKTFWLVANALTLGLHVAGIGCYLAYGAGHSLAMLWLIVVGIHLLELPMAFVAVNNRGIAASTTLAMTIVFGFTWWVPARRGVYAAVG